VQGNTAKKNQIFNQNDLIANLLSGLWFQCTKTPPHRPQKIKSYRSTAGSVNCGVPWPENG